MGPEGMVVARLFGLPVVLSVGGALVGMLLAQAGQSVAGHAVLVGVAELLWQAGRLIASISVLVALGVSVWRWYLLYGWETGKLTGGCDHCGGPVTHKEGRYGAYSKCLICGSKRKGWH